MSLNIAKIHSCTFRVDKETVVSKVRDVNHWLSFKVITLFRFEYFTQRHVSQMDLS